MVRITVNVHCISIHVCSVIRSMRHVLQIKVMLSSYYIIQAFLRVFLTCKLR